jgi:hypothetical protein
MLRSRCVFSMTLAASATLMLQALCVPAVMIEAHSRSTKSAISGVEPEVTLRMPGRRCCLSPGLMRSGLYPTKKSRLKSRPETFARIGTQASSVQPGYTVDSYTTVSPRLSTLPSLAGPDQRRKIRPLGGVDGCGHGDNEHRAAAQVLQEGAVAEACGLGQFRRVHLQRAIATAAQLLSTRAPLMSKPTVS